MLLYLNNMEITKQMYQLAKKIVEEYENKKVVKVVVPKKDIQERKLDFMEQIRPFKHLYSSDMLNNFYLYWSEHGEKDRKFRKEKEKSFNVELRLKTWNKRSKQFNSRNEKPKKKSAAQIIQEKYGINQ